MIDSWEKLTNATAYEASRLIKTETVAMWSQSTKDAYLDNSNNLVMPTIKINNVARVIADNMQKVYIYYTQVINAA